MSVAAYLVCHRDRTLLGLGKPLRPPTGGIRAFSYPSGRISEATFARTLWKYLLDCPTDDLVLHFDSDPEFDTIAEYREIGGDIEDGDVPLADYLAGELEEPAVYYAELRPGRPRSDPGGIVRRRGVSTPVDGTFTRDLRWEPTDLLRRAALGIDDADRIEIPEAEAIAFVLRLLAVRLRPGWPRNEMDRRGVDP